MRTLRDIQVSRFPSGMLARAGLEFLRPTPWFVFDHVANRANVGRQPCEWVKASWVFPTWREAMDKAIELASR